MRDFDVIEEMARRLGLTLDPSSAAPGRREARRTSAAAECTTGHARGGAGPSNRARAAAPAVRHIGGDAPRLVAGEQLRRCATSRLPPEIDVGERLPVGVADDEAGVRFAGSGAVLAAQRGDQRSWGYRNHDDGVLSTTNRADLTFAEATQTRLAARRQALGARPLPPLRRP